MKTKLFRTNPPFGGHDFPDAFDKKNIRRAIALRDKCPNMFLFLVRIFPYSDWITEIYSVSVNLRIQSDYGKIQTRKKSIFVPFSSIRALTCKSSISDNHTSVPISSNNNGSNPESQCILKEKNLHSWSCFKVKSFHLDFFQKPLCRWSAGKCRFTNHEISRISKWDLLSNFLHLLENAFVFFN